MNARFYMPELGRFMQHDPLSSSTLEPYGYGYNNPVLFADPTGLDPKCPPDCSIPPYSPGGTNNPINIKEIVIPAPGNPGGGYGGPYGSYPWGGYGYGDYSPDGYCGFCSSGSSSGYNAYAKEKENNTLGWLGIGNVDRFHASQSTLDNAVANTKVGQSVSAAENFLFLELPASFAGGELLSAGWQAAGISKYLGQAFNYITKGGPTFAEYRAAYWAKNVKPAMKIIEGEGVHVGKQWETFMELHHRFIPQRAKWAPNWLLNNRFNLQPLNALEHAMRDPYRARFAPKWIKEQYNLIWK